MAKKLRGWRKIQGERQERESQSGGDTNLSFKEQHVVEHRNHREKGSECFCLCAFTVCMSGANVGQKRTFDHLELEFQMFVSHHVDAENQTQNLNNGSQRS
ncbi:hypothetical protein STEG23_002144 [Scotinomys teguina]